MASNRAAHPSHQIGFSMQKSEEKLSSIAFQIAKEVSRKLVEDYGARRVYLIGSLAREVDFLPGSDIDLVVEDDKEFQFFLAVADFYWYKGFHVDIKVMSKEKIKDNWRIKEEGGLLCER